MARVQKKGKMYQKKKIATAQRFGASEIFCPKKEIFEHKVAQC